MSKPMTLREKYLALFPGAPLDGTPLAKAIADTVPEVNQQVEMDEFRAALRRSVADRLAADRQVQP